MPSAIERAVSRFRRALDREDAAALRGMSAAYAETWRRVKAKLDAVRRLIEEAEAAGKKAVLRVPGAGAALGPGEYSVNWLYRQGRYIELMQQVDVELAAYTRYAAAMIGRQQQQGLNLGREHAEGLMATSLGPVPKELAAVGIRMSWNRVPDAALKHLVGALADGSPLAYKFKDLPAGVAQGIRDSFAAGFAEGANPRRIAAEIKRVYHGALANGLVTARTETLRAYRGAAHETYRANSNVCRGWIRICARQARTCVACVPSGTVVSGPPVEAARSRFWVGEIVEIDFASGIHLSVTPNHPVLTPKGWVPAGLLNEGENVLGCTDCERAFTGTEPDQHQVPTLIEKIAKSGGFQRCVRLPVAAEDFHGDGGGSEVCIVWSDGLLGNRVNASTEQPFGEQGFADSDVGLGFLPGECHSATSIPRQAGLDPIAPNGHPSLPEPEHDRRSAYAERDSQLLGAFTGGVAAHDFLRQGSPGSAGGSTKACTIEPVSDGDAHLGEPSVDQPPIDTELLGQDSSRLTRVIPIGDGRVGARSPLPPGRGRLVSAELISLLVAAEQSPSLKGIRKTLLGCVDSARSTQDTLPGDICLDRVLKIDKRAFRGQVYSLQTVDGWHFVGASSIPQGIILSNCWSQDGTFHTLDEVLVDHCSGRCVAIPATKSWEEIAGRPVKGVPETGLAPWDAEDGFKRLSAGDQRKVLGPTRYELYGQGKLKLADMATLQKSEVWGDHWRPKTLRELRRKIKEAA